MQVPLLIYQERHASSATIQILLNPSVPSITLSPEFQKHAVGQGLHTAMARSDHHDVFQP